MSKEEKQFGWHIFFTFASICLGKNANSSIGNTNVSYSYTNSRGIAIFFSNMYDHAVYSEDKFLKIAAAILLFYHKYNQFKLSNIHILNHTVTHTHTYTHVCATKPILMAHGLIENAHHHFTNK